MVAMRSLYEHCKSAVQILDQITENLGILLLSLPYFVFSAMWDEKNSPGQVSNFQCLGESSMQST